MTDQVLVGGMTTRESRQQSNLSRCSVATIIRKYREDNRSFKTRQRNTETQRCQQVPAFYLSNMSSAQQGAQEGSVGRSLWGGWQQSLPCGLALTWCWPDQMNCMLPLILQLNLESVMSCHVSVWLIKSKDDCVMNVFVFYFDRLFCFRVSFSSPG